jgi:hypothetical protein
VPGKRYPRKCSPVCPVCDGTGTNVHLNSPDLACQTCNGTGRCALCHGTGVLLYAPRTWGEKRLPIQLFLAGTGLALFCLSSRPQGTIYVLFVAIWLGALWSTVDVKGDLEEMWFRLRHTGRLQTLVEAVRADKASH